MRFDLGVTKRCSLSWLTNSSLAYEPKCGGGDAGTQPLSTAVHRNPTNFGDLTLYLIYGFDIQANRLITVFRRETGATGLNLLRKLCVTTSPSKKLSLTCCMGKQYSQTIQLAAPYKVELPRCSFSHFLPFSMPGRRSLFISEFNKHW
jgi:hypothetical protein